MKRIVQLDAKLVEVHCWCSSTMAIDRYAERARARHPTHVLQAITPEYLTEFSGPIDLGTVLEVDTESPVDVPRLAERVSRLLAD